MSYEIVRSISFRNNEVKVSSYSNNVSPRIAKNWVARCLTEILRHQGKTEAEKEILLEFWKGSFQGQSTKYGKFIESYYSRKNSPFNWDNVGNEEELGGDKYGKKILYTYQTVKNELLLQYEKFLVQSKSKQLFKVKIGGDWVLDLKRTSARMTYCEAYAKKFNQVKVEEIKKRFYKKSIEVLEIQD